MTPRLFRLIVVVTANKFWERALEGVQAKRLSRSTMGTGSAPVYTDLYAPTLAVANPTTISSITIASNH